MAPGKIEGDATTTRGVYASARGEGRMVEQKRNEVIQAPRSPSAYWSRLFPTTPDDTSNSLHQTSLPTQASLRKLVENVGLFEVTLLTRIGTVRGAGQVLVFAGFCGNIPIVLLGWRELFFNAFSNQATCKRILRLVVGTARATGLVRGLHVINVSVVHGHVGVLAHPSETLQQGLGSFHAHAW